MLLLLLACLPTTYPDVESGVTDSGDSAVDTAPPDDTAEEGEVLWTKYKVDTPATVRGIYSSGKGVYLVATRGQAWVGSASDAWAALSLPAELVELDLNGLWGNGKEDTLELAIATDEGLVAIYSLGAWTVWTLGTRDNLGIGGSSLTNLYAVGENGIQHFDGTAWTLETTPEVTMNGVWADESSALAVGNEGVAYRRDGSGVWTATDTGRTANLHDIDGSSSSDLWAGGDQGAVLHWDGGDWSSPVSGTTQTLNAVFADGSDSVMAVGNTGAAVKFDGSGWSTVTTDTNQNLYAVHGVSGSNAWGGGDGGLVMQYVEE